MRRRGARVVSDKYYLESDTAHSSVQPPTQRQPCNGLDVPLLAPENAV